MFDWNFTTKHLSSQHFIPATLKIHLPLVIIVMTIVKQRRWLNKLLGAGESWLGVKQNCGSFGGWNKHSSDFHGGHLTQPSLIPNEETHTGLFFFSK